LINNYFTIYDIKPCADLVRKNMEGIIHYLFNDILLENLNTLGFKVIFISSLNSLIARRERIMFIVNSETGEFSLSNIVTEEEGFVLINKILKLKHT
jgi:hypothetical protein